MRDRSCKETSRANDSKWEVSEREERRRKCLCHSVCVLLWWLIETQNNWDIQAEPEILHAMWAEAHSPNNKHLTHLQTPKKKKKIAILRQNLWKQCSVFFRLKQNGEHDKQVAEKWELVWCRHWTPNQISLNMPCHHSSLLHRKENRRGGGGGAS